MTTDVRLTSGLTRTVFFLMEGVNFFEEKNEKKRGKTGFPLKSGSLGGSRGTEHDYRTPYTHTTNELRNVCVKLN